MRARCAEPPTGVSAYGSTAVSPTPTMPQPGSATSTGFHSGITGAVPLQAPATPGSFGAAPTGQPDFPAITTDLATKYGGMFKSAQKTAGGGIAGGEVLRLLAAVPADTSVKRQAWDLVAGTCPLCVCLCMLSGRSGC